MTVKQQQIDGVNNDKPLDIARTLFGETGESEPDETAQGAEQATTEGTGEQGGSEEAGGDGTESEPGAGEESEGGADGGEVWEFDGAEYTAEQVATALKDQSMFQRFNESITPLVENIRAYAQTAEGWKVAAQTETDKAIGELKRKLASGRLNAAEYQQTHMQLTQAEQRKQILTHEAEREKQQREQALNQARIHNARQVATNLIRAGWNKTELAEVESLARTAFKPDAFADALTPELMELLRDAMKQRKAQSAAAEKLRAEGKRAIQVKTKVNHAAQPKKATKVGTDDWITKSIWGGK